MGDDEQFDSDAVTSDTQDDVQDADEITDGGVLSSADSAAVLVLKERERARLQADIEAFLASGGTITPVDNNVVADPPKKPESSYGSQPI